MESNRLQQIDLTPEDQELIFSRAIEKIKNGKMRELDPTLGDQGCHLRACSLVSVADKVLKDEELAKEEKAFLISLETTTFNTLDMVADNGFFIFNKSYNTKIPTYLKATYSNKGRGAIISRYRVQASVLSNTFLDQKAAKLPETEMNKELKAAFANDKKSVVRDKEILKITPLYSTLRMVLEIILKEGYPVVLIIQQYHQIDGKAIKLESSIPFYYEPNAERTKYQLSQVPDPNKPALCVHFFTLYDNPEKSAVNVDNLLSKIRTTDLVQVLTSCSAMHDQYPNISEEDKLASFEKEETEGLLREEYQKACQLAKSLNFTSERLNKKIVDTFVSELTINEVFQIVHVYCSNYGTETRECEHFNKEEILSTKVAINLDQGKATYKNL